jgi:F0F1-type ATP synthase membrane subunit b/b'
MIFSMSDLLPEHFELKNKNLLTVGVKRLETERFKSKITLDIKQLRPLFKNMKFYYRRKTFPKLEDFGTADVDLTTGQGVRIKAVWVVEGVGDLPLVMNLSKVKCTIDKLDIHIVEAAKHEFLDKVATSLFIGQIKQNIAQAIVDNIVKLVNPFSDQMNDFFKTRPLERFAETTSQQIASAIDTTTTTISSMQPTLQRVGEQIKETAKQVWEHPKEKTEELKEKASEKYEEVKSDLSKKTEEAKETISEKAEQAKEKVQEWTQQPTQEVREPTSRTFGGGEMFEPVATPAIIPEDKTTVDTSLFTEKSTGSPLVSPKVAK